MSTNIPAMTYPGRRASTQEMSPRGPPPHAVPHAPRPSTSRSTRRDSYSPLLTTVHKRHALMKERIEQRWAEVNEQLLVMKAEIRQRWRCKEEPSRAQTALLLGVDGPPSTGGSGQRGRNVRREMAAAAGRAVDEGMLADPTNADVLQVHDGQEQRDGEERSFSVDGRRRQRRADAAVASAAFGLEPEADSLPPTPRPPPPDAFTAHADRWERHSLQPLFDPAVASPTSSSSLPGAAALSHAAPLPTSPSAPSALPQTAPARPLTPRHAYSVYLSSTIKNLVALLMQLDKAAMSSIRSSFQHHPDGLQLYAFVLIAMTYMRSCVGSREDIAALIEMFRDIDVNGDEVMEWEEFTSHLVQLASTYGEDTTGSQLPHFTPSIVEDVSTHDRVCDVVRYVPALKKIVLFERNSRRFKVYSTDLKALTTVRGHRAPLLCCEYWEKVAPHTRDVRMQLSPTSALTLFPRCVCCRVGCC